ncbi:MAG: hypothetical protein COW84_10795 [Gammaproteobacteria bacterium CG22_combo_CG10-13_8_21_14_all_40_8]|nr:MAG: hypothetical protein COW84_10795 [Gammaproteobacteria bacterium CG22_combo_CG10-13_8_21_14_all_40_8]
MLKTRIITALVLLPLVVWVLFGVSLNTFSLAINLIMLIAAWELTALIGIEKLANKMLYLSLIQILFLIIYLSNPNMSLWPGVPFPQQLTQWLDLRYLPYIALVMGSIWWLVCFISLIIGKHDWLKGKSLLWLRVIAGVLMLVPCWVALISLRSTDIVQSFSQGSLLVLYLLLQIWGADTGAYFSGKAFGKHKLAPKVSPKKTWEGVAGGLILAVSLGLFMPHVLHLDYIIHQLGYFQVVLISLVVVVASIVGDLTESIYKRQQNLKDSGTLLPGHGGILDRIDSILSTFPVYALLFYGLIR